MWLLTQIDHSISYLDPGHIYIFVSLSEGKESNQE